MTVKLEDVVDVAELESLIRERHVRVVAHPDDSTLVIYNYTASAVTQEWTPTLRACRGLIVREGVVVARGPAKFFNHGEPEAEGLLDLANGDPFIIVTDKVDGSLGILYRAPDGLPAIATRGSFTSDQAIHATELLRREKLGRARSLLWIDEDYNSTTVFEIVYPENRIVLDYGDRDELVGLGFVGLRNGILYPYPDMTGSDYWSGAERVYQGSLSGWQFEARPNREGVVVMSPGEGFMVKIKQDDYVALHRIVTGLNERTVWEHLSTDRYQELRDKLPAEHALWADGVMQRLFQERRLFLSFITAVHDAERYDSAGNTVPRAQFAAAIAMQPPEIKAGAWLLYDDNLRKLSEYCWKKVRPSGAKVTSRVEEEVA